MNKFLLFLNEAWAELKQVAWLTVPQMLASTWLVIILVIVMAGYLFAIDGVLKFLFERVL